ncbi:6-phosphogluconolactonase [Chelatococcus asaccharovorans]|uniref:6-phosphogluconolactonase n=1 Tax=Chelatococcus asaccharovorans TaxID=28210 RepID=UPI00224C6711|nr:6-phosphogluconolactonase [Chelatococcus asaccharovorans]CAH1667213.1 Glucosamine-6-phosphate deaminase [Chelatococcus asaccharovorans]CAH1681083.1 Glucosamine-6-phosphate deaminase [Chelatococcus asaccharovorans]
MVSVAGQQLARPVVLSFATRAEMGQAAAADVAAELRARLARQAGVRMIFAAAVSQSEMLQALVAAPGIDWGRVTAFHMDEYLDLPAQAPQRFGNWLRRAIFDRLPFAAVKLIDPGPDAAAAVKAYAASLAEAPIDIVCLGIGVNGHLAFNDPPVADFVDPQSVKIVTLDDVCRQQQVDDGAFATVADVPRRAVTLTIPRLLDADRLFCVVPGASKREAVARALDGPLETDCPASALRLHPDCRLYLDAESDPRS